MPRRIPRARTSRARELRNGATDQERAVWHRIAPYRPRFTRQLPIGPYTADLACRKVRLVVEIDGSQHMDSASDEARTRFLERKGWTVIRFWNSDVDESPNSVAEAILLKVGELLGVSPEPHPRRRLNSPP